MDGVFGEPDLAGFQEDAFVELTEVGQDVHVFQGGRFPAQEQLLQPYCIVVANEEEEKGER